ncbi:MAG: 3-ketosteroid-9-alpha-hydroxylase, partial [Aeromicrobium sp.]|nr:3-ketosteroid-9-alpha-hydroxylase [Aeromicrobium sp.]
RDPDSIIFERQLKTLVDKYERRLHVYYWVESRQGLPTKDFLETTIAKHASRHIYVCGPAGFMSLATSAAHAASHPRDQMHLEVFVSLKGDPFADEAVVDIEPDAANPADSTPVEVEINGETLNLEWSPKQTLVDLLLAKNVDVPFLCRDGECGTCQATIESGAVSMDRNDVLDPQDVADGYILTCQARPDGNDPIRIVF